MLNPRKTRLRDGGGGGGFPQKMPEYVYLTKDRKVTGKRVELGFFTRCGKAADGERITPGLNPVPRRIINYRIHLYFYKEHGLPLSLLVS